MAIKRNKRRLEPVSLEELENSPSQIGLERVLRFEIPKIGPVVPSPASLGGGEQRAAPGGVADVPPGGGTVMPPGGTMHTPPVGVSQPSIAPTLLRRGPQAIMPPVGVSDVPPGGATETPPPFELVASPEFTAAVDVRHIRLRRVRTVQDGLTPGEFLLLTEMFKVGTPLPDSKDRELGSSGYRTMSARTGQDPKTVKRNRQGLLRKRCIDVVGQNTFTEATRCLVRHFDNILGVWRQHNMAWVRRSGRSVEFADPGGGEWPVAGLVEASTSPGGVSLVPPVGTSDIPTVGTSEAPVGETPPGGVGETPPGGVGVSATYLSITSILKKEPSTSSTSTTPPAVVEALRETTGHADDEIVAKIVSECRQRAPDASVEEIAHFVREQGGRIMQMKGIDRPIGLLIRQVPLCFEGESFRQYREATHRQRQAERQQGREVAAKILEAPEEWPEDQVHWARKILGPDSS